jgi:hypothetical protein
MTTTLAQYEFSFASPITCATDDRPHFAIPIDRKIKGLIDLVTVNEFSNSVNIFLEQAAWQS